MPTIYFPHLGLEFNINAIAFELFGLPIYWYGIIITAGMVLGLLIGSYIAKKEGLDPDVVMDFLMIDIVFAILGARLYFVAFNWPYYRENLGEIFNIRQGGIAIYGAIIVSFLVAIIYTHKKKINLWQFGDIAAYSLLIGQAIGRYGNFVNQEAFGDYTNGLFAMQLEKQHALAHINQATMSQFVAIQPENIITKGALEYIQVHPTFFYESTWNIALFVLLLVFYKYKKHHGQIFFMYVAGYGLGRFWIEGLRTDQLIVPGIEIPASQIVAIGSILVGLIGLLWCRKQENKCNNFNKL